MAKQDLRTRYYKIPIIRVNSNHPDIIESQKLSAEHLIHLK